MPTLEEKLSQQILDEEIPVIVSQLQGIAREKGAEITRLPGNGWPIGELLSLNAGKQSFVLRRVEARDIDARFDSAILFSLPEGKSDSCFLARTLKGWYASNPTTREQALPQGPGVYSPGIHEGTGWVPVSDVLDWLQEQIKSTSGGNHA